MDRIEFERLVRDALNSLYDHAALQIHPLVAYLAPAAEAQRSRGEQLRQALLAAIERLRPTERDLSPGSAEWRPYLLLQGRYVEGASLPELQARLALSERQLRREHGRALEAVAGLLWDQVFPDRAAGEAGGVGELAAEAFALATEPLDMGELILGVAATRRRRIDAEGAVLAVAAPAALPRALADRVLLRQVLLSLLGHAFDATSDGRVAVEATLQGARVGVVIRYATAGPPPEEPAVLKNALPWAQRLQAELALEPVPAGAGVR
jgi:signal transduction histidine kinase